MPDVPDRLRPDRVGNVRERVRVERSARIVAPDSHVPLHIGEESRIRSGRHRIAKSRREQNVDPPTSDGESTHDFENGSSKKNRSGWTRRTKKIFFLKEMLSAHDASERDTGLCGAATEHDDSSCALCLAEIGRFDSCVTKCGHRVHLSCIGNALRRKGSCPICRGTLIVEDEHHEDTSILSLIHI